MFIRVEGKVLETIHRGDVSTSKLIELTKGRSVAIMVDNDSKIEKELIPGAEVDLICKLQALATDKGYTVFYNNMIYFVDKFSNIDNLKENTKRRDKFKI